MGYLSKGPCKQHVKFDWLVNVNCITGVRIELPQQFRFPKSLDSRGLIGGLNHLRGGLKRLIGVYTNIRNNGQSATLLIKNGEDLKESLNRCHDAVPDVP